MPKIYTKKGDTGETTLLNGKKVTKDCVNLRVVGEMDELNCVLGIAINTIKEKDAKNLSHLLNMLVSIQRDLFLAGAEVSVLQNPFVINKSTVIPAKAGILLSSVTELENQIDAWNAELPELKNFILPGGKNGAANLHHARAVCRRVERELVALGKEKKVRSELCQYFNRLSDFLFVAARWVDAQ